MGRQWWTTMRTALSYRSSASGSQTWLPIWEPCGNFRKIWVSGLHLQRHWLDWLGKSWGIRIVTDLRSIPCHRQEHWGLENQTTQFQFIGPENKRSLCTVSLLYTPHMRLIKITTAAPCIQDTGRKTETSVKYFFLIIEVMDNKAHKVKFRLLERLIMYSLKCR